MFERFTTAARQVVVQAQDEARRMHHDHIGTEHLLLGLLGQPPTPTAEVLARHGLAHASVRTAIAGHLGGDDLDADALTTLGIDLDAVRERVEEAFGPGALDAPGAGRRGSTGGHIPFTPRAKKVLELALREAIAMKSRSISDGHIALGLIREDQGLAMKVVHDRGVDPEALRQQLRTALGG